MDDVVESASRTSSILHAKSAVPISFLQSLTHPSIDNNNLIIFNSILATSLFHRISLSVRKSGEQMLPMNIAEAEAGGEQSPPTAEERNRRQQVIRVGLVICLFLVLSQPAPPQAVTKVASGGNAPGDSAAVSDLNSDYVGQLNSMTRELSEGYQQNATGLYKGTWSSPSSEFQFGILPGNILPNTKIAFLENSTNLIDSTDLKESKRTSSGVMELQIVDNFIPEVDNVHFLHGIAKMKEAGIKKNGVNTDVLYPLQGLYFTNTGELKLLSSSFQDQKLYLEIDTNSIASKSVSAGSSATSKDKISVDHNRKLVSIPTFDFRNNIQGQERSESGGVVSWVMNIMGRSSKIDLFAEYGKQQYISNERHRKLAGEVTSLIPPTHTEEFVMGDSTYRLLMASNNYVSSRSNSSKSVISVLGQKSLSPVFRIVQQQTLNYELTNKIPVCDLRIDMKTSKLDTKKGDDREVPIIPVTQGNSGTGQPYTRLSIPDENSESSTDSQEFTKEVFGTAESNACGINYNVTANSFHLQIDALERKTSGYAVIATLVCALQISLLVMQIGYASSQAIAIKMSIVGLCSQSILDALICVSHLLLSASVPGLFVRDFMWIAILKLFLFCVFEMRLIVSIYQARYAQELSSEGFGGLRRRLASLHLRFYGAVFLFMFAAISLYDRPIYLVFLLYSYWVPQIVYNAMTGTKKAFHKGYLYGMAISRLYIPLYIYGCPKNFTSLMIFDSTAPTLFSAEACIVLVLWTAIQVGLLVCQDHYGSRFFVPKYFLPQRYDYSRSIPGGGSSERLTIDAENENADLESGDLPECIICYNSIESTHGTYMVAPCDHVFHKDCLTRWMEVKSECPTCRCVLPPDQED